MKLRDLVTRGCAAGKAETSCAVAAAPVASLPEPGLWPASPAESGAAKWLVLTSRALDGEQVLVVFDKRHLKEARRAHPGLVVYFPPEIDEINRHKDRPGFPQFFKSVHLVKKRFDGWIIPSDSPLARRYEWPTPRQADPTGGSDAHGGTQRNRQAG